MFLLKYDLLPTYQRQAYTDENQDSPEGDMVNPSGEDSHVAHSGRTLDSQALTNSCTLCYVR